MDGESADALGSLELCGTEGDPAAMDALEHLRAQVYTMAQSLQGTRWPLRRVLA